LEILWIWQLQVLVLQMLEAALQYPALYVFWSGMSFSSPIVAGLAGLVWSANMSLTNAQVDQILRNTADNIGDPFLFGAGRVNANAAVLAAGGTPPPTPTQAPTPPPAADPVLIGLNPNVAGQSNSITVTDAPPGKGILLMYSPNPGQSVIPNGACKGETLDLADPAKIARGRSYANGRVTIEFRAPKSYIPGTQLNFQAHVANGKLCRVSNVVGKTLNGQ
jgi:hypothetical protein